jgi:hypothetical protein
MRENGMAGAARRKVAPLSVAAFRAWLQSRPDEERWELIDGVAMMMAPPTRDHQRIASNLERLLNDALELPRPTLSAYQRVGLDLGAVAENYDPEPDVAVIDANPGETRAIRTGSISPPKWSRTRTGERSMASARSTSAIRAATTFWSCGRTSVRSASPFAATMAGTMLC